jgi:hypothetical protein
MFNNASNLTAGDTKFGGRNDDFEIAEIGAYRAPELQPAGRATKLVQGWAFSGYDCGYSTFYYC